MKRSKKLAWLLIVPVLLSAAPVHGEEAWQRDKRALLFNFNNMYNPCVVETGGRYRYRMWFFGWAADTANSAYPGCDAIFHARSKDMVRWEVYSGNGRWDKTMTPEKWVPVIHAGERWFEKFHAGDPSVVFKDDCYYMAYSATSEHFSARAGYPSTMVQCIMGAVSKDGIRWERTDRPLLICPEDTADPAPSPDRIGDYHRPSLHWMDGKWRLWFDYSVPGHGTAMGYAENTVDFERPGGFKVQHDLDKPLLRHWPNPEVIRIGDTYRCFSDPPGYPKKKEESPWMGRQLREAVSKDGMNWELLDYIPPDEDTDACHVPQTLLTEIDGKQWLYLFYATQTGYSKNDGRYHYQYNRIRAMRRPVKDNGQESLNRTVAEK